MTTHFRYGRNTSCNYYCVNCAQGSDESLGLEEVSPLDISTIESSRLYHVLLTILNSEDPVSCVITITQICGTYADAETAKSVARKIHGDLVGKERQHDSRHHGRQIRPDNDNAEAEPRLESPSTLPTRGVGGNVKVEVCETATDPSLEASDSNDLHYVVEVSLHNHKQQTEPIVEANVKAVFKAPADARRMMGSLVGRWQNTKKVSLAEKDDVSDWLCYLCSEVLCNSA